MFQVVICVADTGEDRIALPELVKGRSLLRGKRKFTIKTIQESHSERM